LPVRGVAIKGTKYVGVLGRELGNFIIGRAKGELCPFQTLSRFVPVRLPLLPLELTQTRVRLSDRGSHRNEKVHPEALYSVCGKAVLFGQELNGFRRKRRLCSPREAFPLKRVLFRHHRLFSGACGLCPSISNASPTATFTDVGMAVLPDGKRYLPGLIQRRHRSERRRIRSITLLKIVAA
jgi:hypothetical protein